MLTRGVNEIQLFIYIRSGGNNYFVIKKGGLLWQDSLGVVAVSLSADDVIGQDKVVRISYPVVVYVCKKKSHRSIIFHKGYQCLSTSSIQ